MPGIVRLAFGSIDYSADLGCAHSRDALLTAHCELVLALRLASIASPLDGVTTVMDDEGIVGGDARYSASLGFGGKLCTHPRQVGPTKGGYFPDEETIDWARRVLASAGDAVKVDGEDGGRTCPHWCSSNSRAARTLQR